MNVGIGTEAALFPEKEYIMEISFAVYRSRPLIYFPPLKGERGVVYLSTLLFKTKKS
jgi:hypothetical protein